MQAQKYNNLHRQSAPLTRRASPPEEHATRSFGLQRRVKLYRDTRGSSGLRRFGALLLQVGLLFRVAGRMDRSNSTVNTVAFHFWVPTAGLGSVLVYAEVTHKRVNCGNPQVVNV